MSCESPGACDRCDIAPSESMLTSCMLHPDAAYSSNAANEHSVLLQRCVPYVHHRLADTHHVAFLPALAQAQQPQVRSSPPLARAPRRSWSLLTSSPKIPLQTLDAQAFQLLVNSLERTNFQHPGAAKSANEGKNDGSVFGNRCRR